MPCVGENTSCSLLIASFSAKCSSPFAKLSLVIVSIGKIRVIISAPIYDSACSTMNLLEEMCFSESEVSSSLLSASIDCSCRSSSLCSLYLLIFLESENAVQQTSASEIETKRSMPKTKISVVSARKASFCAFPLAQLISSRIHLSDRRPEGW